MAFVPDIEIQEIVAASNFTGVLPNGVVPTTNAGAPFHGGRIKYFGSGTDGGLFTAPQDSGITLIEMWVWCPGATRWQCSVQNSLFPVGAGVSIGIPLFDSDAVGGMLTHSYAMTATGLVDTKDAAADEKAPSIDPEKFLWRPDMPVFIPPGYSIQVISTGNVSGGNVGRIEFRFGGGWGRRTMQQVITG